MFGGQPFGSGYFGQGPPRAVTPTNPGPSSLVRFLQNTVLQPLQLPGLSPTLSPVFRSERVTLLPFPSHNNIVVRLPLFVAERTFIPRITGEAASPRD